MPTHTVRGVRPGVKRRYRYVMQNGKRVASDPVERFLLDVEKTASCWIWTASRGKQGYGYFHANGKTRRAHRFAYEALVGPIPPGLDVLHKCDNPPCCNPDHLFVGTDKDNQRDALAKGRRLPFPKRRISPKEWYRQNPGRAQKGSERPDAKLTEADIPTIIDKVKSGRSMRSVAADYGVRDTVVRGIMQGTRWKHAIPANQLIQTATLAVKQMDDAPAPN